MHARRSNQPQNSQNITIQNQTFDEVPRHYQTQQHINHAVNPNFQEQQTQTFDTRNKRVEITQHTAQLVTNTSGQQFVLMPVDPSAINHTPPIPSQIFSPVINQRDQRPAHNVNLPMSVAGLLNSDFTSDS